MIKIVKSGKKEFYCICDNCGCEFTCELEDIKFESGLTDSRIRTVVCPECGSTCYINTPKNTPPTPLQIGWPTPGEPIPWNIPSDTALDPCSTCDWWKKMQQPGFTYVGDTPCTWCSKGPYRVTCGTTTATLQLNPEDLKKYNLNIYGYQSASGGTNSSNSLKSDSNSVKFCNSCHKDTKASNKNNCNCKE